MGNKNDLRKKIYILLFIGGLIVAANGAVSYLIFGPASWNAWRVANGAHFIGGLYAFFFLRAIFEYTKETHQIKAPPAVEFVLLVMGALMLGLFWEWFEFAIDRYQVLILGRRSVMTYADNIGDLIIDALGATAAAIFAYCRLTAGK